MVIGQCSWSHDEHFSFLAMDAHYGMTSFWFVKLFVLKCSVRPWVGSLQCGFYI